MIHGQIWAYSEVRPTEWFVYTLKGSKVTIEKKASPRIYRYQPCLAGFKCEFVFVLGGLDPLCATKGFDSCDIYSISSDTW